MIDCGLHFCLAVCVCIKTVSSPVQKHNEPSFQIGNLSRLSGNKQWPVDNGSLVLLSSSCSYIRPTGMPMAYHNIVGSISVSVYLKLKGQAKHSFSTTSHCMSSLRGKKDLWSSKSY